MKSLKNNFIDICKKKFGDLYTYDKTNYINSKTKIIITDKNGNDIEITPYSLLRRRTKKTNKYTTKFFIEKSKEIFGENTFSYEKTNCNNSYDDVIITCPKHGDFLKKAYVHLVNKQGCPYCNNKRNNLEQFIEKARKVHGNKYDYSKVEYINNSTKVCIICPIHGEFWQTPQAHINNEGCRLCTYEKSIKNVNDFINDSNLKERNIKLKEHTYYSMNKKATFICEKCGYEWEAKPIKIQVGRGCPKCANKIPLTNKDFIEKSNLIHNHKYVYDKVNIIAMSKKIIITCPKHGDFKQEPFRHLRGEGCPFCKESKLEKNISIILDNNGIKFERYKTYDNLKNRNKLSYDFYLPDYNILIECQGIQHFKPNNFFGGINAFETQKVNDIIKYNFANENNIKIIYYTNKDYEYFLNEKLIKNEIDLIKEIKGE